MIKLLDILNEANKPVNFYFDNTEDNLNKYVVEDNDDKLYQAVIGMKKGSRYIKFRISHPSYNARFNIRLNKGKVKEVNKSKFIKELSKFNTNKDLDKLYRG